MDLATRALEQTSQIVTYHPFSFLSINNYTIPILHHRHHNDFPLHSEDSCATSLVVPTLTLTCTHVRSCSCSYSISHTHTRSLAHTFKHISTLEHVPDPFVLTGACVHTRSRCVAHATSLIMFTLHWRVYSPRLTLNVGLRWMRDIALVISITFAIANIHPFFCSFSRRIVGPSISLYETHSSAYGHGTMYCVAIYITCFTHSKLVDISLFIHTIMPVSLSPSD